MTEIIEDAFTVRLLAVYVELIKKGAIAKKKDFSTAIDLPQSHFINIEKKERNYPQSLEKRNKAISGLFHLYGVKAEYMNGIEKKMFWREPEKVLRSVSLESVQINFRDKKQKMELLQELEKLRQENDRLRAENTQLRTELDAYHRMNIAAETVEKYQRKNIQEATRTEPLQLPSGTPTQTTSGTPTQNANPDNNSDKKP